MSNDEVTVAHEFLHQTLAFDALFDILVRQDKPDFSINPSFPIGARKADF